MIKPDKILAGNIAIYYDVLDDPMRVVKALEKAGASDPRFAWDRAPIHQGIISDYRSNDAINMSAIRSTPAGGDPALEDLAAEDLRVFEAIRPRVLSYAEWEDIRIGGDEGWQVLRYRPGTEYKAHQDYHKDNQRIMSAILYLNDDFIGGETEFIRFDESVKPKAGMLALFPANYAYTHVAKGLLSGTKYVVVSWFHE